MADFSPELGKVLPTGSFSPSGAGAGVVEPDGSGQLYRRCLNTDDTDIFHGKALRRNPLNLTSPGLVILAGASGVGQISEGVAYILGENDRKAAPGEYFWACIEGTIALASGAGTSTGGSIIAGSQLTPGGANAGDLFPLATASGVPASGFQKIGQALSANTDAGTSGIFMEVFRSPTIQ